MKAHIGKTVIGFLAFDENEKLVASKLFPNDPAVIKKKLAEDNPSELEDIKNQLKSKDFEPVLDEKGDQLARSNFRKIAVKVNYVKSQVDLNKLIMQVSTAKTKESIKRAVKKDKLVIQVVSAIDDLDKILNQLSERLREWFGLHYPEFRPKSHETYAQMIAEHGQRENFSEFKESMGIDFDENDAEVVSSYAGTIHDLYKERENMQKYLGDLMKDVAPNLTEMLSDIIAARMIAHAGGLDRLAKMPSSTIQVIGAEKALFRHLKGGGKPPKHGLIFQSPLINQAPKESRGKIARLLAAKLTIAIRADAYGGKYIADALKHDLQEKIKEATE